jgi:hypothetical protein
MGNRRGKSSQTNQEKNIEQNLIERRRMKSGDLGDFT